jgi:hypothetical protein
VADVVEAEQFELRRSPRAEVSQAVTTIDYDRTSAVERYRRIAQDASDRNVDRAADMRSLVLVRGQGVDDLHLPRREHRGEFTMPDFTHS